MNFTFSIDEYDRDGDIADEGIFLHLGNLRINIGKDVAAIDDLINNLKLIKKEILENYPEVK